MRHAFASRPNKEEAWDRIKTGTSKTRTIRTIRCRARVVEAGDRVDRVGPAAPDSADRDRGAAWAPADRVEAAARVVVAAVATAPVAALEAEAPAARARA